MPRNASGSRAENRPPTASQYSGRADPVVVVAGAEDAAHEGEAHDDVEPLLDDLAVDTGELDEQVRQDRAHDQLPDALDPQVHHPPAEVRVEHLVVEPDHARQVQQRRGGEAHQQHEAGGGVPFALETVMPMLSKKASTFTTTRKSSGRGISRNLRPSHQLKWKPMIAVTPTTTSEAHWAHGQLRLHSSRFDSSGMM
jgi:hypothetical protein